MSKNLYIDLHVIQTLPPSCVNRDDTGSPKTAIYGGVTREEFQVNPGNVQCALCLLICIQKKKREFEQRKL